MARSASFSKGRRGRVLTKLSNPPECLQSHLGKEDGTHTAPTRHSHVTHTTPTRHPHGADTTPRNTPNLSRPKDRACKRIVAKALGKTNYRTKRFATKPFLFEFCCCDIRLRGKSSICPATYYGGKIDLPYIPYIFGPRLHPAQVQCWDYR